MAAPTTPIASTAARFKIGANTLGGHESGSLELFSDRLNTVPCSPTEWRNTVHALKRWVANVQIACLESAGAVFAVGSITYNSQALARVQRLTINITNEESDVSDDLSWYEWIGGERGAEVDFEGVYQDPNGTGGEGLQELLDNIMGTDADAAAVVTFANNGSLSGTMGWNRIRPLDVSGRERIGMTGNGEFVGAVTDGSSSMDAAFAAVLAAALDASQLAVEINFDTPVSGQTYWTGNARVQALQITSPYNEPTRANITLVGDGALTQNATT